MGFDQDDECYFCYLFTRWNNPVHQGCREGEPCNDNHGYEDEEDQECVLASGGKYNVCKTCLGTSDEYHRYLWARLNDEVKDYCAVCDNRSKCFAIITCADHGGNISRHFVLDDSSSSDSDAEPVDNVDTEE